MPMIGCDCGVCRSTDPRDARTRPSIALTLDDGTTVLVDTTPDLRILLMTVAFCLVSAVFFGLGPAWRHARTDALPPQEITIAVNEMIRTYKPVARMAISLRYNYERW